MTNMNLFHALMMILLLIFTILNIASRGAPITLANMKILDIASLVSIIFFMLDIATDGKYRTRRLVLITVVFSLILGTICGLAYSNF